MSWSVTSHAVPSLGAPFPGTACLAPSNPAGIGLSPKPGDPALGCGPSGTGDPAATGHMIRGLDAVAMGPITTGTRARAIPLPRSRVGELGSTRAIPPSTGVVLWEPCPNNWKSSALEELGDAFGDA